MDAELKTQADALFAELGMNIQRHLTFLSVNLSVRAACLFI